MESTTEMSKRVLKKSAAVIFFHLCFVFFLSLPVAIYDGAEPAPLPLGQRTNAVTVYS